VLGGAIAFTIYYTPRPPVPESKLRAVTLGMSDGAVRELLGPPTSIYSVSNDAALGLPGTNRDEQWIYERRLVWSSVWVNVHLTNGSVCRISGDSFP
jgi:hypothetical protein